LILPLIIFPGHLLSHRALFFLELPFFLELLFFPRPLLSYRALFFLKLLFSPKTLFFLGLLLFLKIVQPQRAVIAF
jgi:hypothetical protein